ncbi:MAG: nucleotide modification associated domain-containing protein [Flavobacterium sp.]
MKTIQAQALALFEKKNTDYGDAFANYGTVGVLVRVGDKIQRLISVSNRGIQLVGDESLRDTLIDLHNYAAMAIMLLDRT